MNPIDFFQKQTEIWNGKQYCDSCWFFGAPLSESALNVQQLRDGSECCYQVMITDYSTSTRSDYNSSQFVTRKICDHRFTMYVVKQSRPDINNYNEIDNHCTKESKWKTIIEPLFNCLSCESVIDYCEILGYPVQIPEWNVVKVINHLDNNFDGVRITGVFRQIL